MKVIISKKDPHFNGYIHLKRLEDLKEVKGNIEYLILGNLESVDTGVLASLTSFCMANKPENLIYISSKDNTNLNLKTCIIGLGGKYYDEDFFLENQNDLETLLEDKEEINTLMTLPGEGILRDFKKRFEEGRLNNPTPQYLKVVFNALGDVTEEYSNKKNEIEAISQETISIFKDISKITEASSKELDSLKEQLNSLIEKVESNEYSQPAQVSYQGVVYFPRIQAREGTKKILKIKDVGGTRYLFSFLLGFVKFMYEVKYLKPKLIFIDHVSELNNILYKDYTFITKDSYQRTDLFNKKNIIFTSHPTINVMNLLLSEDVKDIFIVVDRTSTFKEHLLKGGEVLFAANSSNVLGKLGIRKEDRISKEGTGSFIELKEIEGYSDDVVMRERQYLNKFKEEYEKLLRRILNGR